MQTFEEFRKKTLRLEGKGHKNFKVRGSFGVYDVYKIIRKNHWFNIGRPIKEKDYYKTIRSINKYLAENIANGKTVVFPAKMGKLELRKIETGVSIVDNKLKITYPVNWKETLKLWYNDKEAKEAKTLIRDEEPFVYRVKYCKATANYENKIFYKFDLNQFIQKALKENIKNKKVDTLW